MIGRSNSFLSLFTLAAIAIAGLAGPGCAPQNPLAGGDFANDKPVYERYTDLRPTAVASCLDDNPNPPAGCL
jgi:hypothetical protein